MDQLIQLVNGIIENKQPLNESLDQIKPLLLSLNSEQIESALQSIDFPLLLNNLNLITDELNILQVIAVLDIVISSLSPKYILSLLINEISTGLLSTNDQITELWLKTLNRCFGDQLAVNNLINSNVNINHILLRVIELLLHPNLTLANYCHSILLNMVKTNGLQLAFFEHESQQKLSEIKGSNDIVKMRVYQLLVDVANTSHLALNRIDNCQHFAEMIDDFIHSIKTDPLIALNLMQIITDFGSTSFGTSFLESSSILEIMATKLKDSDSDMFASLLIPGYVKIFGTIAYNKPIILTHYPIILDKITQILDSNDLTLKMCAIDAIANICRRNEGKVIVNTKQQLIDRLMNSINHLLYNGSTESKVSALNAISNILGCNESDANGDATTVTESWFNQLFAVNSLTSLLQICKQPIMEIRLAALECVRVLAASIWGQKQLAATSGFLQYVLDRSTEFQKDGKEAKYRIIRELVISPFITLSFTREAMQRLRAFYKEGPFYIENEVAVSFEGAD